MASGKHPFIYGLHAQAGARFFRLEQFQPIKDGDPVGICLEWRGCLFCAAAIYF